ncbi:MAG TPA: hypothetical protein VFU02_03555 [Polyangiaceae bacterium]|nr:hypothetical protein [Polyangiaceae bacterium]
MKASILELLGTIGAGALVMGCGGSTDVHSLGNLPDAGGATSTGSNTTASSGGAGGGSGPNTSGGTGGSGENTGIAGLPDCATLPDQPCRLVEGHDIRALATDGTRLYWIEYGTEDDLGNSRYDGRIMAQDLVGGATEPVVEDLGDPVGLALSESYFYVHAERWLHESGGETTALVRLPRAGGAAELIQDDLSSRGPEGNGNCPYPCFAATRDFSYFYHLGSIHRVSEEPGATSSVLWAGADPPFVCDPENTVYANTQAHGLEQLPFEAEEAEPLREYVQSFQWDAGALYWVEVPNDSAYLVRWQRGEGPSERVAELTRRGPNRTSLKVAQGHYFVFLENWSEGEEVSMIVSGSLAEPERVTKRVELAYPFDGGSYFSQRWLGTPEAIYWIEDGAIVRAP